MKKILTEKDKNLQQIPFRLHINDHKALKSKIALDGVKMQTLFEACVIAYLNDDQYVKKLVLDMKDQNTVDKKKTSFSNREQENLLDEIESISENVKIP